MITPKSDRLGTQSILPLLFKLAVPSILGMSFQALYTVVDSMYVGRVSTEALSALSLAFPIQMVLISVAVGTGVGTTSLISRTLGRGDHKRAGNIAEHVILLSLVYGIIWALVGIFFAEKLIGLFTADPVLRVLSSGYIRIILFGSIALFVPMIFNNILRGEGNTFIPMLTMAIGAFLNIAIDPLLIFGIGPFPELGVKGAAYATVISRIFSGTFIVLILFSDKNEIKIHMKNFHYDGTILKELYRIGIPAMSLQLLASVMLAGGNLILAMHNTAAIAVFGIFFRLQSFIFMPVFGLGQGVMPVAGYNYGARNPERIKETIKYGALFAFLFTFTGFLIFQIFPHRLITMFNSDPKLVAIGVSAMRKISIGFLFVGPSIIGINVFQALGKGTPSLVLSFLRTIVLLLPSMYLLGELFGLDFLWFAFPISESFTFSIGALWLIITLRRIFSAMRAETGM
ncbi:MAG: MATE family efflux transporter [Spirochaetaceae bacterium]